MNSFAEVIKTILSVLKWWTTVTPWEQGVRVRAGRYVKHLGPGVHLCVPFLDRAYVQTTRARVMTVPTQTVTTKDGKTVTIGATIGFEIVDVPKLYATIHDVTGTIVSFAVSVVAEQVARAEAATLSLATLSAAATAELQFDQYGLAHGEVRITDFAIVRAYRLISDQRWSSDDRIDTIRHGSAV